MATTCRVLCVAALSSTTEGVSATIVGPMFCSLLCVYSAVLCISCVPDPATVGSCFVFCVLDSSPPCVFCFQLKLGYLVVC